MDLNRHLVYFKLEELYREAESQLGRRPTDEELSGIESKFISNCGNEVLERTFDAFCYQAVSDYMKSKRIKRRHEL